MKPLTGSIVTLVLVLGSASTSHAQTTGLVAPEGCPTAAEVLPGSAAPDLAGLWDFTITVGTASVRGEMALGHMDGAYAGALTPETTNTVVVRRLELAGDAIRMTVASGEGEVLFDGRLAPSGNSMCGIVTYHGGVRYPMTAMRRPGRADAAATSS